MLMESRRKFREVLTHLVYEYLHMVNEEWELGPLKKKILDKSFWEEENLEII